MANTRRTKKKPVKKSSQKPRKSVTVAPKRVRRSTKSTQVTGGDIDVALEKLASKTLLERKIDDKRTTDEDNHPNTLVSTNYEERSPFDADEDVDVEVENRHRMYSVPPKPRSPEGGRGSQDRNADSAEDAEKAYHLYFD